MNKIIKNLKQNKGFSLIELIIVIAILAILIGVLAPSLINNIEKSRRSKCISDRDSLRTQIDIGVISGDYDDEEEAFNDLSDNIKENTCKSNGEYTFKWVNEDQHIYQILCSAHDDDETSDMSFNIDDIINVIKNNIGSTSQLDSNATNVSDKCVTSKVLNALEESGLNMGNLSATTWKYVNGGDKFFYWTSESLDKYEVGDTLPVFRYNVNSGTYTIWTAKVCLGKTDTSTEQYKQLGGSGSNEFTAYTPSTDQTGGSASQTYENALQMYQQYLKEHQN